MKFSRQKEMKIPTGESQWRWKKVEKLGNFKNWYCKDIAIIISYVVETRGRGMDYSWFSSLFKFYNYKNSSKSSSLSSFCSSLYFVTSLSLSESILHHQLYTKPWSQYSFPVFVCLSIFIIFPLALCFISHNSNSCPVY